MAVEISRFYLQSRSSEVFQTGINPAAVFGKGIFLDHATGLVAVPARAVGTAGCAEPSRSMNQILSQLAYDSFTYTI